MKEIKELIDEEGNVINIEDNEEIKTMGKGDDEPDDE